ncbi:hypothetical protein [Mycobacterium deserti]|uniref:Uncharacterized protein n=1 Tax=Mycobacterium deserti TaxID=2978347 RepID=A0ABT2M7U0_9MYCO|nr:hypothetical protein [Mycobacterium deserti]MCT7658001.1 hypothetical protein [Mycobacterium deserti]
MAVRIGKMLVQRGSPPAATENGYPSSATKAPVFVASAADVDVRRWNAWGYRDRRTQRDVIVA